MTSDSILSNAGVMGQPEYLQFRDWHAKNKLPLVIFFGSGLSSPAGLPTWDGLKNVLLKSAKAKVDAINKIGDDLYGLSSKLNAAETQKNYWISFKLLKEILTEPTYISIVRQALTPTKDAVLPSGYKEIIKLSPRGLVTVNLDSFAANALAEHNPLKSPIPIYGNEISRKWEIIQYSDPFLVYLHGHIVDSGSWVLTNDDLTSLLSSPGHKPFLQQIFLNYRVLFFGMSADDISISSRLIDLRSAGFRTENLFWLTSKKEKNVRDWADANHVKIILYKPDPSHSEVLSALVSDCNSFIPIEENFAPIISSSTMPDVVEEKSHSEIVNWDPESIRGYLSSYLNHKLKITNKDFHYNVLSDTINKYKRAIHNSYYVDETEGNNVWFGHKLVFPHLGEGTFGQVHLALSPMGKEVAVKIMRENVHAKSDMLGGFRRGVRSMKIISEAKLNGMVEIIDAFELPPTIIMKNISGKDLDSIILEKHRFSWNAKIEILIKIVEIVRAAHLLTETVIHRDIKPTNVMISNFDYSHNDNPEVVVLDFDMSWHKGSIEKDVIFESRDDFAYLSPEQVDSSKAHLCTSTLVDSYGFGMTAFYLMSENHPQINAYLSKDWQALLLQACSKRYQGHWMSAPNRLSRLLMRCTQLDQNLRPDFGQILTELTSLKIATTTPTKIVNTELVAEETLASIAGVNSYVWDNYINSGSYVSGRGIKINSLSDIKNNIVYVRITWTGTGFVNRSNITKYLQDAVSKAESLVKNTNWSLEQTNRGAGELTMSISANANSILNKKSTSLEIVRKFYKCFDFA